MSSLIDKGKVADKISDLFLGNYQNPSKELETFYKEVLKIVVNAETQGEWISVKDRLPEDDGKYMICCKYDFEICEFDAESQTFGYTYDEYDEMYSRLVCWDDYINKKVTHWMPLPQKPESEE